MWFLNIIVPILIATFGPMFDPRYKSLEDKNEDLEETIEARTVHYQETESFYYNELGEKIRKIEIMETKLEKVKEEREELIETKRDLLLIHQRKDSIINYQERKTDANINNINPIRVTKI